MDQPGDQVSRDGAAELIGTHDVASLGRKAYRRKQEVSGDTVYYLAEPTEPVPPGRGETQIDGEGLDVLVEYGAEPGTEVLDRFEEVRELNRGGGVRCVELVPTDRTTAYDDLRVVGVARLYLDGVGVRVSSEVGSKLVQTALEFGADDVGYMGEYDDVELLIGEAGFTPVERGSHNHD